MGRVLTNNISIQAAREASLGVLGGSPDWKLLEPNSVGSFGATITTVKRQPISKDRQNRKGTVTDLDSSVEFEADLTMDVFAEFIEGFCMATAVNSDLFFEKIDVGATGYTIPAATAAQAAKLQFTSGGPISLVYGRGYANSANNGLKPLSADVSASDTAIQFAGATTETAPAKAIVEIAGIRPELGDLALTVSGTTGTLSSGNNGATNNIDFTTLGLTVGQFIHIGGLTSSEQFSVGAGYARITAIAAGSLTLDKMDSVLVTDPGTGETVDLLFGRFIRNVSVDDTDYLEISYQFEGSYPNLGAGGVTEYEYALGNYCNQVTFNLPLTEKATCSFGFVGTDTEVPTTTRKSGASNARETARDDALNTSADVARLRITEVDETGLTTDFKSFSITLLNNVAGEKVIAQLGAKYMNTGNFEVNTDGQILFTNGEVVSAIRNNTTVTMDFVLTNQDGAIAVDIPSLTLGGGGKDFPVNESVLLNTTGMAFKDGTLDTSLGVSMFAIVP
ncbi:major capsid protein [Roseobacter phage RDJL6]|nr:major capsid protein [Roseobacter phage RDJL6]